MLKKVIHKFYLVGGILVLLLLIGYAQLAIFLHYESQSTIRGQEAVLIEREIRSLEDIFFQIRFWEKSILSGKPSEADKKFGTLMEQMNKRLGTLKANPIDEEIEKGIGRVSTFVKQYERAFNKIVQLKTGQRLDQTLFDSNYQSLISNIFRTNEISLLKPLFNLSHFQTGYLSNHRESEYQALKLVVGSLENRLLKKNLLDERLNGYIETYKRILSHDFFLEKEIQKLITHFDQLSTKLSSHFLSVSTMAGEILEIEIHKAARFRNRLNQSFIISMALGLLGVLIIFTLIARQIVHPVRSIAEVGRNIRSGNINSRFVYKGKQRDEVIQLGWDLNDMLDTLDEKNKQLFTYQKELEGKIKQLGRREAELQKHRDNLEELVDERAQELSRTIEQLQEEIRQRKQAEGELKNANRKN